ncbi:MAG: serine/threonine protein kinase, partial [Prevotella sp.]|nr:serine/threonine protein kinase [Prevotella sp.]
GKSSYDAARANWGGSWRLPTSEELTELKDNCYWTWTTMNGHNGYKVTGMNGNSIYLPANGEKNGSSLTGEGTMGCYWSATPNYTDNTRVIFLDFESSGYWVFNGDRYLGMSVRPVTD